MQMISYCSNPFVQSIIYLLVTTKYVKIYLRSSFQNFKCNDNQCATSEFFSPIQCSEITQSLIEGGSYVQILL